MKVIKHIVAITTLGILPLSVHAMSLTFDFTGGPTIATSRSFTVDGVTLDVTAQRVDTNTSIFVSQNNNAGIGACLDMLNCGANLNTDDPQLDSFKPGEILTFAVSGGPIRLDSFLFGAYAQANADRDNFIFTVDGFAYNGGLPFHSFQDLWDVAGAFGSVIAYNSFSIQAIANPELSSFRITELRATKLPEPGTLGMLLLGLTSIGFIRRRRSH